ncbi:MAG TPA: hypothetical protein VK528_07440 [Flavobacterium sp.]|nr:hypothetical protein [Flavobacterium sp.]
MKKLLLLLALTFATTNYAQLSFSKSHVGPPAEFKKGIKERFKASTTIFVVPSTFTKESYEAILKDNWTASNYKVVTAAEFNIKNYLTDAFSFVWLRMDIISDNNIFYTKTYFDVFMLENEKMVKKIDKVIDNESKYLDLVDDNKINFASIPLQLSNKYFNDVKKKLNPTVRLIFSSPGPEKIHEVYKFIFDNKALNNFEPGFVKNDFQRLNNTINAGKVYWMYGSDKKPEIKELKKATLLLPDYVTSEFGSMSGKEEIRDEKKMKELLDKYKSKYEILSQEAISQKILAGEDFYYFKYTRVIASKLTEVVNAKTGDVIYRNYAAITYNLKDKDFENLK